MTVIRHSVDDARYQELLAAEAEVERLRAAQDEPIITADDIIESLLQQLRGAVKDRRELAAMLAQAALALHHAGYAEDAASARAVIRQHGGQ